MSPAVRNRHPQRRFHLDNRIPAILDADDKSAKDSDKLSPNDIAVWFGISISWVFARRYDERFPDVDQFGRRSRGDLRRWLRDRQRQLEAA